MIHANRIDVHQHVLPPGYTDWLRSKGIADCAAINRENAAALFPDWRA